MILVKLCPSCGAKEGERDFNGAFCIECSAKLAPPAKTAKGISVTVCPKCNTGRTGQDGFQYSEKALETQVLKKAKPAGDVSRMTVELEKVKPDVYIATVTTCHEGNGKEFCKTSRTRVEVTHKTCEQCSLRSGGFHLGLIQLRGDLEKCQEMAPKITRHCERESYVSGIEEKKEGIDIKVGDSRTAASALGRLGLKFSKASTLVGEKEGQRIYRQTLLVRL